MRIPDHLTCLLRNLYAGQEATVKTGHGTTDWFQIGKGVCQSCILSPCFLTHMQSTLCEMWGRMKHKVESRLPGESHGRRSLVGYSLRVTKSDTTKRLHSLSLSAIRVVSSAYLRILIFLPAVLIPACVSSRLAFLMMYSEYK